MALEMVLNELSLQRAEELQTARQWMSTFIQTVIEATSHQAFMAGRFEPPRGFGYFLLSGIIILSH